MLVVVYDSLTGLGKKFANSLEMPSQSVWKKLEEPCILVSRNSGAGQIPWTTKRFIRKYRRLIKGFVINGNQKRYPRTFCGATDKIVEQYGLRHIRNIEGSGTEEDRQTVKDFLEQLQTDESSHKSN
ncbi:MULTISPECIES: class Ib ribonucleoside-diphosphate reductase assembly flavoprotein NrdI [Streptococcus]|uniref:class Ib ribonucleoside-diphosphate reductase assembly flavoprotein NrdI n=1 Tax=Streptococcus TaxID=1301 RepID=UPI002284D296|nr:MULTISPECIES: class Ib ribonucleoside-diphosphate reductase assembly flavoprotein NrdI [Streptococcus]MCY7032689.1 class Ib ribonucleoside-diphosphate reductase assembly flavoprotein NrdI [Streptococcus sanguinis]WNU94206.1 class Ib ribonucleoside-diphosphate reductase assembly flavoprotein NrdI [Streptococcus sp. DTU_2020_1000888_1_SI_GRL_NUU_041A]